MNIEFFNFIDMWKDDYDHFIMDRGIFIDEDDKSHYFAYIYPVTTPIPDMKIDNYLLNDCIKFERKRMTVEEVIELVKNIKIDQEKREMTIQYSDGVDYTFTTEQFALEEQLKVKDRYGKTGIYTPCYRLIAKSQSHIFKDNVFTTSSKIGYSNVVIAAKDIFNHNDFMFSRESYTSDVIYPLIIDLTHFEWNIKRFEYFRNTVEIEIKSMSNKEIKKPLGMLNVEFTNGRYELRMLKFNENTTKEVFRHNVASGEFFLQATTNRGFKGDVNTPKPDGKVLDYRSFRRYSIQSEDYISLEELSVSEIERMVEQKETVTVEFKSVLEQMDQINYKEIGKQMTGMANAKAKGLVIVGVTKIGQLEGIGELSSEQFMQNLQQELDSNCDPWIDFEIKDFELSSSEQKIKILVVSLLADKKKRPYLYRKGKSIFDIPLRRGDTTKWLSPKEIKDYMIELHKEEN